MLKTIKAVAIGILIATAAVAVVVFGAFIGAVLLFLGAVAVVALVLWGCWLVYQDHQNEKRDGE